MIEDHEKAASSQRMEYYENLILKKCGLLENILGFIDGTIR
jgi:hypothetical protein